MRSGLGRNSSVSNQGANALPIRCDAYRPSSPADSESTATRARQAARIRSDCRRRRDLPSATTSPDGRARAEAPPLDRSGGLPGHGAVSMGDHLVDILGAFDEPAPHAIVVVRRSRLPGSRAEPPGRTLRRARIGHRARLAHDRTAEPARRAPLVRATPEAPTTGGDRVPLPIGGARPQTVHTHVAPGRRGRGGSEHQSGRSHGADHQQPNEFPFPRSAQPPTARVSIIDQHHFACGRHTVQPLPSGRCVRVHADSPAPFPALLSSGRGLFRR